jgi:glycosyltransferase involved in cell wall biosynthesis
MAAPVTPVPVHFVSSHARRGGSERYLVSLLGRLDRSWIGGVTCLEDGPLVDDLRALDLRVDVVPVGASPPALVAGALRLGRRFEGRPVVHANGVKAALVCALAPSRQRLVWVKHDFSWDGGLARAIAARCRIVVGVTEAVLGVLRRGPKLRVVHTGIDAPTVDREGGRRRLVDLLGVDEGARIALVVGKLHPVKGQLDVVNAAVELDDVHAAFVGGDDPDHPGYATTVRARIAELAMGDRLHLRGFEPNAAELIAGADALIVSSRAADTLRAGEGFGLAALEALHVGTPVVAYAEGGVPEVVGSCALLVRPGDIEGLTAAMRVALSDGARREELAACGRRRAVDEFSPGRWIEEMKRCYLAANG